MNTNDYTSEPQLHPVLGRFEPEEILIEYDAPLVFVFHDRMGRQAIAYLAQSKKGETRYVAALVSNQILDSMKNGLLPIRSAFTHKVWVIVVGEGGQVMSVGEESSNSASHLLPPESLCVFLD